MPLILYLISQKENNDYDTYSSAIVAADSPKEAKNMHPDNDYVWNGTIWCLRGDDSWISDSWCDPKFVKVKVIGIAGPRIKRGTVLASFHAG